MDWYKKIWVLLRYRKQAMMHIIIINNLKAQIEAEWDAIWEMVDNIKKEMK